MRRHDVTLSGAVLALLVSGCAPSLANLLQERRYADAVCLASNEDEAKQAAQATLQSLEPRLFVHAATQQEWTALLGEARAKQAAAQLLALRGTWVSDPISIRKIDLRFAASVRKPHSNDLETLPNATSYEQRRIAVAATGESIPSRRYEEVTQSWTPAKPRDPLGAILSLFAPSSSTSTIVLDPTDAQYAAAGPLAFALVNALTEGDDATGYLLPKDGLRGAVLRMEVQLEDDLRGAGGCSLHVQKELAVRLDEPGVEARIAGLFGGRYRPIVALPGSMRVWMSNPRGWWSFDLQGNSAPSSD